MSEGWGGDGCERAEYSDEPDLGSNRATFDPIEAMFGREPTAEEIQRANAAVTANLNDDYTPKWGSAQGYACALTAIMQVASGMSAGTAETQSGSGLQPAWPTAKPGRPDDID